MAKQLTLSDVFSYVGTGQRCLIEGEEVLRSNHVVSCGFTSKTNAKVDIVALCLQTSALTQAPHEIRCTLSETNPIIIQCSCKAGLGGKCKHCIAVLLYINREGLDNLEDLSSTDIKQQWGRLKSRASELYTPRPISELCHVKMTDDREQLNSRKPEDDYAAFVKAASEALTESALAKHIKGRKPFEECPRNENESRNVHCELELHNYAISDVALPPKVVALYQYMQQNESTDDFIATLKQFELCSRCKEKYETVAVDVNSMKKLCATTEDTNCQQWKMQRYIRITGSKCYSLYTYGGRANCNWKSKISKHLASFNFKGTAQTKYGVQNEQYALKWYEEKHNCGIQRFGIVVHPSLPWLGYSPDGVRFEDGMPNVLLEIKCPYEGAEKGASDLNVSYIKCSKDGNFSLNQKHAYYGQIQLGLFLLGLRNCHLIIYASCNNSAIEINVPYNEAFTYCMLKKLHFVYFKYLLPVLSGTWECNVEIE